MHYSFLSKKTKQYRYTMQLYDVELKRVKCKVKKNFKEVWHNQAVCEQWIKM